MPTKATPWGLFDLVANPCSGTLTGALRNLLMGVCAADLGGATSSAMESEIGDFYYYDLS